MTYQRRCSRFLCDCTCTWQGGGAATGQRAPLSCRGLEVGCPFGQRRCPHFTALPNMDLSRRTVLTAHLTARGGGEGDRRIHPISNHKCPPIRPCESCFDGKRVCLLCVLDKPRHHGGDLRALGVCRRHNAPIRIAVEDAVLRRPNEGILCVIAHAARIGERQGAAHSGRPGIAIML